MAAKKPAAKKPSAKPTAKIPMSKKSSAPTPTRKPGIIVALPDGSTVDMRDIGKVKPTPKPKPKVTSKVDNTMTKQDKIMQKILKEKYGW